MTTRSDVDIALGQELALLTDAQRREAEIEIRARAEQIAGELGLDAHDVRVILKSATLTPSERLRRGLALGRQVRRLAE